MRCRILCLMVGLLLLASCSQEVKTFPVSGTVSWNGKPIPEGVINFIAEDMAVAPDTGKIVNGKYETRVKAGRKKIEIYAHRAKKENAVMGQGERENYIPPKFNALSTLIREVKPEGENVFDFALSEKD